MNFIKINTDDDCRKTDKTFVHFEMNKFDRKMALPICIFIMKLMAQSNILYKNHCFKDMYLTVKRGKESAM